MDVVFVVMPFADVGRPAIGVSLLKAAAARAGYSISIEYLNLAARRARSASTSTRCSRVRFRPNLLVGEWFFADDAVRQRHPRRGGLISTKSSSSIATAETVAAVRVRASAAGRVSRCGASPGLLRAQPSVVGFTTTFHQTCACLAVAAPAEGTARSAGHRVRRRQLRRRDGRCSCSQLLPLDRLRLLRRGRHRSFASCSTSCSASASHARSRRAGARTRERAGATLQSRFATSTSCPIPDYDDYFARLAAIRHWPQHRFEPHLVFETSRGCWWGAKHHCTFCGLNGDTMAFRSKSPDRAFDEIDRPVAGVMASRSVGCVDNILDMRYVDTLFPRLRRQRPTSSSCSTR